jgi:hypothetical protein
MRRSLAARAIIDCGVAGGLWSDAKINS